MTNESDLVPLHMHNLLTAGPAPWTDTRVPSEVWHVARAVYGTSTEDDEKRVYRTLQAALWKLAAPQPEAQPQWQPIETAPKDGWFLAFKPGVAHIVGTILDSDHPDCEFDGGVHEAWSHHHVDGITHWMPLPDAPSAQAEPTDTAGALMQQIREVCAATLKAGPGVAVPMPDAVRSEMQLFMRGEPNLIERLPFCDVVALSESEEVQALAAPSAQAVPRKPNYRAECWPDSPHNKQAEQGGK